MLHLVGCNLEIWSPPPHHSETQLWYEQSKAVIRGKIKSLRHASIHVTSLSQQNDNKAYKM